MRYGKQRPWTRPFLPLQGRIHLLQSFGSPSEDVRRRECLLCLYSCCLGFDFSRFLHITHSEGGWYLRSHWLTGKLHLISLLSGHDFLHARYLSYRKCISPTATECERGHCDIVSLPRTGFREWHNITIASAAVVVWTDHIFGIDMSDVAWTRICRANTECHCG